MAKKEAKKENDEGAGKDVIPWADRMAESAKEVAEIETSSLNTISIKNGVLKVNGDPVPDSEMAVVIISSVTERRLYTKAYDADHIVNPDCYAQSLLGLDMAPAENVPEPISETCRNCPMDAFGTAQNGKGKACKESRKLAVIPVSALEQPEKIKAAELGILSVPITSVKKFWGPYVKGLEAQHHRPPWGVVTKIKASPDDRTMLKVEFALDSLVEDDCLGHIHARIEDVNKLLLNGYDYSTEGAGEAKESGKY